MNRIVRFSLLALAAVITRTALAQNDTLIIAGAGVAGKWDTQLELANVSPNPVDVTLWIEGLPLGVPCPPNCTSGGGTIPGGGTMSIRASDFIGAAYPGPQILHVEASNGPLPVVHARSISSESPCQFAELPVVRESTILELDASLLVFPGAARGEGFYTNLILESLALVPTTVEVELADPDGHVLGSAVLTVPGQVTGSAFTLVDVAGFFGVPSLENGQVRVRNTTASGPIWGVLATVGTEGSLRVSLGANP